MYENLWSPLQMYAISYKLQHQRGTVCYFWKCCGYNAKILYEKCFLFIIKTLLVIASDSFYPYKIWNTTNI